MKASRKLVGDVDKLEQQMEGDIARLAAELDLLPQTRDPSSLNAAWVQVTSSRRKLARFLREALRNCNASNATGALQRSQFRAASKDLRASETMLGLWARVRPVVLAQLSSERSELIPSGLESDRDIEVLDHVVNLFFRSMHKIANPGADRQSDAAKSHGCYGDIPYPMHLFSRMIGAAHRICLAQRRRKPLRFLDVGSGGGTKVLAATMCFDLCDGLEYDEFAVTTGRRFLEILEPERCRLIHGDALQFSDYGAYDVIFFYGPMIETRKLSKVVNRILCQASRGTVLLKAGSFGVDNLLSKAAHKLAHQVYITGMSEDEASELAETAERMGSMVPGFRPESFSRHGYWRPLLEVSARNGYYI